MYSSVYCWIFTAIITILDCGLHGRLTLMHNQLLNFLNRRTVSNMWLRWVFWSLSSYNPQLILALLLHLLSESIHCVAVECASVHYSPNLGIKLCCAMNEHQTFMNYYIIHRLCMIFHVSILFSSRSWSWPTNSNWMHPKGKRELSTLLRWLAQAMMTLVSSCWMIIMEQGFIP